MSDINKKDEDIFNEEFLKTLGYIRRLRKQLRECSSDTIIQMRDRLNILISEHEDEELKIIERNETKQQKIKELKSILKQSGLSEEEIKDSLLATPVQKAKRNKSPQKYLFIDEDGKKHRWSGRGKAPLVFRELINKDIDIDEECLAKNLE